jgi:hypothetical protein
VFKPNQRGTGEVGFLVGMFGELGVSMYKPSRPAAEFLGPGSVRYPDLLQYSGM